MHRLIYLFSLLLSFHSVAFQVQPMVAELAPSGSNAQQTIRVMNNSSASLAIELTAFDLKITPSGEEQLTTNDADFFIIPMTTIIAPGKSQSILIRYVGDPILAASKSYRIGVDQVMIDTGESNQSGVGIATSFRTLFTVVPEGATAKLVIEQKQQQQEGLWKVRLKNEGNKLLRLSKSTWFIEQHDDTMNLAGEELSRALSGKLLLPHSSREVLLKVPKQFKAEQSKLKVQF